MRNITILLFLVFLSKINFGQIPNYFPIDLGLVKKKIILPTIIINKLNYQLIKNSKFIQYSPITSSNIQKVSFIYNYKPNQAFFCKKEYELEKKINFPIKFRLATYEYTYKLEYNK